MSDSNKKFTTNSQIVELLTVLFIGLKLTGYINWSWWWVLSPVWIMASIVVIFVLIFLIVAAVK